MRIVIFALFAVSVCSAQVAVNGLGASTYTCVDRDGDGYGTGPGCTGRDADDLDSTVHTGAQAIAKYGTLAAFLKHLGYTPTRTWYIATTGNDSTCVSAGAPVGIGSPCATATPVLTNLAAGDMVIYRAGTYLESGAFAPSVNGSAGSPIIVMAYPGETVTLDMSATLQANMNLQDRSYITVDGFILTKGQNGGCIAGGSFDSMAASNAFHDNVFRHLEAFLCKWGIVAAGLDNVTVEDSVFHDNDANSGEHGVYFGSRGAEIAHNVTIRRCITYNNGINGFHMNGIMTNLVVEQNIAYGNKTADYDFQNGTRNSFFRSNISIGPGQKGVVFSVYDGNEFGGSQPASSCGASGTDPCTCSPSPNANAICSNDMTNNVIENYTFYGTTTASDGITSAVGVPAVLVARQALCTTAWCLGRSIGSNAFRNIAAAGYTDGSGNYQPVVFPDTGTGWPQSSTFDSLVLWNSDTTHSANIFGYGAGSSYGFQGYTCSSPPAGITLTNCHNADPKFIAASPDYWNSISSFDLRLSPSSPALRSGTLTGVPAFDLKGRAFTGAPAPSMGALERQLFVNGWNDLGSASALTASVCPADGASGSVDNSGNPYPYQANCGDLYYTWNSAIMRDNPQLEAMWIFGGGHTDSADNSVYKITLNTTSPAISRVTNPSQVVAADYGTAPVGLPSAAPVAPDARHTWGEMAWLPTQDSLWILGGCNYGSCPEYMDTWTLTLSTLTWARKDPTSGFQPFGSVESWVQHGASAYDSVTDAVYTLNNGWPLSYVPATNTYTLGSNGSSNIANPAGVVDTSRRIFSQIADGFVFQLDISGGPSSLPANTCLISSDATPVAGCSAVIDPSCDALVNADGPGLIYNAVIDRIVGYLENGGNTIYFMNPQTMSCTTQTFSGGPPNNGQSVVTGINGRFNYSKDMDVYMVANGFNQDAFVLNLNASDPTGNNSSPRSTISAGAISTGAVIQ